MAEDITPKQMRKEIKEAQVEVVKLRYALNKAAYAGKDQVKAAKDLVTATEKEVELREKLVETNSKNISLIKEQVPAMQQAMQIGQQAGQVAGSGGISGVLTKGAKLFETGIQGFIRGLPGGALLMGVVVAFRTLYDKAAEINASLVEVNVASGNFARAEQITSKELTDMAFRLRSTGLVKNVDEAMDQFRVMSAELPGWARAIADQSAALDDFAMTQVRMGVGARELARFQGLYARTLRSTSVAQDLVRRTSIDESDYIKELNLTRQGFARETMQAAEALKGLDEMRLVPDYIRLIGEAATKTKLAGDQIGDVSAALARGGKQMPLALQAIVGAQMGGETMLESIYLAQVKPQQAATRAVTMLTEGLTGGLVAAKESSLAYREQTVLAQMFGAQIAKVTLDVKEMGTVVEFGRTADFKSLDKAAKRRDTFTQEQADGAAHMVKSMRGSGDFIKDVWTATIVSVNNEMVRMRDLIAEGNYAAAMRAGIPVTPGINESSARIIADALKKAIPREIRVE